MTTPKTGCPLEKLNDLTPLSATTTCPDPAAAYQRLWTDWGGPVAAVELEPGIPAWLVMGYRELRAVVRNEQHYSRNSKNWRLLADGHIGADSGLAPIMFPRDNAYFSDGATHRRLRAPLVDGLARISEHRVARDVGETCDRLIDRLPADGQLDLVAQYAAQVPMLTVAGLFGIAPDLGDRLQTCVIALFGSGEDSAERFHEMETILTGVINEHHTAPAEDLTTAFLHHPCHRDDGEVLASMLLMLGAGWETLQVWIAQTLRIMLTDPRFDGKVRGGHLGIDDALDHVLWADPPMANQPTRWALTDTVVGGQRIARGDALILGLAAANNDRWAGAHDRHDPGNRAHLAFGVGPHACPAQRTSRIIARTAVETILHRLPDVRLAVPATEIPLHPSPWTRGPARLPVTATRALGQATPVPSPRSTEAPPNR
ncbi:cytochrome P450 [Amycolatopsis sp. OK19-0408]|uniref:Cytochrome P450 n=1 Tax=Amycolatopsis iheyensis TaxID=2945988 RepID=A0A9X2SNT1_9PSEU|nr:cytochrome P450 [Amycolatopsis iheyensis]MCR6488333.1 cytochrome P450 [Amycolatopsis iheyensis]